MEKFGYILAWTLGWPEILLALVIALIIFGRRLPEVARSLGKSLTEFKKGVKETKDDIEDAVSSENNDKKEDGSAN